MQVSTCGAAKVSSRKHAHAEIMQHANLGRPRRSLESRCKVQTNTQISLLYNVNINEPSKLLISRILLLTLIAYLTHWPDNVGHCLQTNSSLSTTTNATTQKPSLRDSDTTINVNDTNTSSEVLLLSGEDFVDSREVPSILFDGTTNNEEPATTTLRPDSEKQDQSINSTLVEAQPVDDGTNSSQILSPSASNNSSSLSVVSADDNLSATPRPATLINVLSSTTSQPTMSEDEETDTATEAADGEGDQDISSNGANMNEKPFEPPQNISQYMDYIEKLFYDLRHQITDLFEPHLPQLIRTSQMVDLSSSCSYDMLRMALALRQFEPWALRMIDSSGKVPEGIFEGTFTALGSYDECLNTVFTPQTSANNGHESNSNAGDANGNKHDGPTQGQYCLVTVSPFMPPKPPADKVDRLFQEEANRRNYTRDDQFSRLSPMFYYMKFRIGVCIPSSCHQQDMGSIADALSSSLRLNISIPDCRVRRPEGEPLTGHQLAGGLIFGLVCASVLAATLLDCFKLKWKQIRSQERELCVVGGGCGGQKTSPQIASAVAVASHPDGLQRQCSGFLIGMAPTIQGNQRQVGEIEIGKTFSERLRKHWSWMSFSLLANFRLHFGPTRTAHGGAEVTGNDDKMEPHDNQRHIHSPQVISCLNGIRVLSLCWVIVANSYLTLDPRATKRLTKTREAPRDFLFQVIVQASLAIETFFFLSGLLMSLSFARQLRPSANDERITSKTRRAQLHQLLKWVRFYVHRYVRMTPPTMLVIAFSMYAYHYGDGPLWFEATQRVHQSCAQNWWRHLLHVANFIDTRQMCFIHYWYIAADMQLFLFAPVLLLILYKSRALGYLLCALIGCLSIGSVFYTTYARNLPPTLLFYSTDPESRREFGNSIMTKPFAHAMPYLVGMLVGWCCVTTSSRDSHGRPVSEQQQADTSRATSAPSFSFTLTSWRTGGNSFSLTGLFGTLALVIALVELFLPYKWNNSHLPSRLCSALYAALFRFGWSLVLAFIVISCKHRRSNRCSSLSSPSSASDNYSTGQCWCFCGTGGNHLNRLLGLGAFEHLSKLSFVAYLVHLPLMSVFIGQTRGLFAFSHTLVLHFAISYLVMSFALSFVLAHVIEFPFVTFERLLFDKLDRYIGADSIKCEQSPTDRKEKKPYHKHTATMLRLEMNDKPKTNHMAVASKQQQVHRTTTGAPIDDAHRNGGNLATYKL